jgi:hypothetical protein
VTNFDNLDTVVRAHGLVFPFSGIVGESRALVEAELNGAFSTVIKNFLEELDWPSVCEVGLCISVF